MADEVVVGATKKLFILTVEDEGGVPIDISGSTFHLVGTSEDIDAVIDEAGSLSDPQRGEVSWVGIGGYLDVADLGDHNSALFHMRAKWTDVSSQVDYTALFDWLYVLPPDVTP